jgi:hypothetical protein
MSVAVFTDAVQIWLSSGSLDANEPSWACDTGARARATMVTRKATTRRPLFVFARALTSRCAGFATRRESEIDHRIENRSISDLRPRARMI